jgi:hypothetical protein
MSGLPPNADIIAFTPGAIHRRRGRASRRRNKSVLRCSPRAARKFAGMATSAATIRAKAARLYEKAAALKDPLERQRCIFEAIELEDLADKILRGPGPAYFDSDRAPGRLKTMWRRMSAWF